MTILEIIKAKTVLMTAIASAMEAAFKAGLDYKQVQDTFEEVTSQIENTDTAYDR